MTDSILREIPATPGLCPAPATFDPEQVLDVPKLAAFLTARGIETSERQAMRLFAERGFPRFFLGKRQYVLAGKAWRHVTSRRRP